jgi:hypothetical protein
MFSKITNHSEILPLQSLVFEFLYFKKSRTKTVENLKNSRTKYFFSKLFTPPAALAAQQRVAEVRKFQNVGLYPSICTVFFQFTSRLVCSNIIQLSQLFICTWPKPEGKPTFLRMPHPP